MAWVTSPEGVLGQVPDANVDAAIRKGYKLANPPAERNKPIQANVEEALRTATFGVSDYIGKNIGAGMNNITPEQEGKLIEARRDNNSTALGTVAGLFTPGVGLASDLATGVSKLAGTGLKAAVTRGGVNGGLLGVGQFISEASLDDANATVEKAIANVGAGALTGGLVEGAAAGGLAVVKSAASRLVKGAGGAALSGRLSELATEGADRVRSDHLFSEKDLGKYNTEARLPEITKWARENNIFAGGTDESVSELAKAKADEYYQAGREFLSQIDAQGPIGSMLPRPPVDLGINKLADTIDQYVEKKATNDITRNALAPVSALADQLRSGGTRGTTGLWDMYVALGERLPEDTRKALGTDLLNVRNVIKDHLAETLDQAGPGFGKDFKDLVKAEGYAVAVKNAAAARAEEVAHLAGTPFARGSAVAGALAFSGPGAAVAAAGVPYVNRAAKKYGSYLLADALDKVGDSKALETMAKGFKSFVDNAYLQQGLGKFAQTLGAASAKGGLELLAAHAQLATAHPDYLSTLGLQNETPEAAEFYGKKLALLDSLHGQSDDTEKRVDSHLKGFFSGKGFDGEYGDYKPGLKDFNARLNALTDLIHNPEGIAKALPADVVNGLPSATAAAASVLQRGAQHLLDKAPRSPYEGMPTALRPDWSPSSQDLDAWYASLMGVEQPLKVLADLQKGHARPEAVEGLKVTYPALFEHMRETMFEHLTKQKAALDFDKRLRLAGVFGPEYVGVAMPELATIQQLHSQQAPSPPQQAPGGSGPDGRMMIDSNKNLQSQSERIANRGVS